MPSNKPLTNDQRIAAFWAKVDKKGPNDCWLWTGAKSDGYGFFSTGTHGIIASRFSKQLEVGLIPSDICMLHKNGCSSRACVNPAHLYLGSKKDNRRDLFNNGFVFKKRGLLSGEQVEAVKILLSKGLPQREIADIMDCHQSTISNIVRGKIAYYERVVYTKEA